MKKRQQAFSVAIALNMILTSTVPYTSSIVSYAKDSETFTKVTEDNPNLDILGTPVINSNEATFPNAKYNKDVCGFEIRTSKTTNYTLNGENKVSADGIIKSFKKLTPQEFTELLQSMKITISPGEKSNISIKVGNSPKDFIYFEENGSYYKIIKHGGVDINEYKKIAQSYEHYGVEGTPIIIKTTAENEFISNATGNNIIQLGIYYDNGWKWSDGSSIESDLKDKKPCSNWNISGDGKSKPAIIQYKESVTTKTDWGDCTYSHSNPKWNITNLVAKIDNNNEVLGEIISSGVIQNPKNRDASTLIDKNTNTSKPDESKMNTTPPNDVEETNSIDLSKGLDKAVITSSRGFILGFKVEADGSEPIEIQYTENGKEKTVTNNVINFYDKYTLDEAQSIIRSIKINETKYVNIKVTLGNIKPHIYFNPENKHYYTKEKGYVDASTYKETARKHTLYGETGYPATIVNSAENTFVYDNLYKNNLYDSFVGFGGYVNPEKETVTWLGGPEENEISNYINFSPINKNANRTIADYWTTSSIWGNTTYVNCYLVEYGTSSMPAPTKKCSDNIDINIEHMQAEEINSIDLSKGLDKAVITSSRDFILGFKVEADTSEPIEIQYTENGKEKTVANNVINFYDKYTVDETQNIIRSIKVNTTKEVNIKVILGNLKPTIVYSKEDGHYYEYVNNPLNWTDAKAAAEKRLFMGLNGYLATIQSESINTLLNSIRSNENIATWIGLTDKEKEGEWKWITGEEFKFENWIKGKPDGGTSQNYALLEYNKNPNWNDEYDYASWSDGKASYFVEYGNLGENLPAPTKQVSDEIKIQQEIQSIGTIKLGDAVKEGEYYTFPKAIIENSHDILGFKIEVTSKDPFEIEYTLNGKVEKSYKKTLNFYDKYTVAELTNIIKSLKVCSYSKDDITLEVTLGNQKDACMYNPVNKHYYLLGSGSKANLKNYEEVAAKYTLYGEIGYPATITTPFENQFAYNMAAKNGSSCAVIGVKGNSDTSLTFIGGPEKGKICEFTPDVAATYPHTNTLMSFYFSPNRWQYASESDSYLIEFGNKAMLPPTIQVSDKVSFKGVELPEAEKTIGSIKLGDAVKEGNYYKFPNVQVENSRDILGFKIEVTSNDPFEMEYMLNGKMEKSYKKTLNFYDKYTVAELTNIIKSLKVCSYSKDDITLEVTLGNKKDGSMYNPLNGHYYLLGSGSKVNLKNYEEVAAKYTLYGEIGYPATITTPFENQFAYNMAAKNGSTCAVIGVKGNSDTSLTFIGGSEKGKICEFTPEVAATYPHTNTLMSFYFSPNRWQYASESDLYLIEFGNKAMLAPTTQVSDKVSFKGVEMPEAEKSIGTIKLGDAVKEGNYYKFPNVQVENSRDILGFKIEIDTKGPFMIDYMLKGERVSNYNKTINFYDKYTVAEVNEIIKSMRVYSYTKDKNIDLKITIGNTKDGYIYDPVNKHYYLLGSGSKVNLKNYEEVAAKYTLYGEIGYPATITTPFENQFAYNMAAKKSSHLASIGVKGNSDKSLSFIGGPEKGKICEFTPEVAVTQPYTNTLMGFYFSPNRWQYAYESDSYLIEFGNKAMSAPTTTVESDLITLEGIASKNVIILNTPKKNGNIVKIPDANIVVEQPTQLKIKISPTDPKKEKKTRFSPLMLFSYISKAADDIKVEYTLDGKKKETTDLEIVTPPLTQKQANEVLNSLEIVNPTNKSINLGVSFKDVTDSSGKEIKDTKFVDMNSPNISGYSPVIEVIKGSNLSELDKIKATDDIDGDLTNSIKWTFTNPKGVNENSIDTNKLGIWSVTLEVSDKAKNKATQSFKVSIIKDPVSIKESIKLETSKDSDGSTKLHWNLVPNIGEYEIYKKIGDNPSKKLTNVKSNINSYKDSILTDNVAPNMDYFHVKLSEHTARVKFNIEDVAQVIEYQIKGIDPEGFLEAYSNSKTLKSDISGVAGLSFVKDTNPNTEVDTTVDTTDTKFIFEKLKDTEYLHVAAIDKEGNKSKTMHIKLLDAEFNAQPVIKVPGLNQVFKKDSSFEPMKDVSAYDFEDGDLTTKIKITGVVDTSTAGVKQIQYEVEDSDGLKTTTLVNIHIPGDIRLDVINGVNSIDISWTKEEKASKYKVFRTNSDGNDFEEIKEINSIDTIAFKDLTATDKRSPNLYSIHEIKNPGDTDSRLKLSYKDYHSTYRYFIQALDKHDNFINSSEINYGTSSTKIKGYSFSIDDNKDGTVDTSLDTSDLASIDLKNNFGKILHLRVIDGNGNASGVKHHIIGGRYDTDLIPVIHGLNTLIINEGDKLDLMNKVTATDIEDGDLTSKIKITSNVNTKINSKYTVIYSVTDSDGNTRTVERIIIVKGKYNSKVSVNKQDNYIKVLWDRNKINKDTNITYEVQRFNGKLDAYKAIYVGENISEYIDPNSKDTLGPKIIDLNYAKVPNSNSIRFQINAKDIGVKYSYKILHRLKDNTIIGETNELVGAISGEVIGYSFAVNNNKDYKVDNTVDIKSLDSFAIDSKNFDYIHFAPIDSFGNIGQQVTITTSEPINNAPQIKGAKSKRVIQGSKFNKLSGVSAVDKEDGNLTNKMQVKGDVDTLTLGDYIVTYKVIDSKGIETTVKRNIKVVTVTTPNYPLPIDFPGVPYVTMNPDKLYLLVNSKDYNLMSGITVKDKEDGKLTDKVTFETDLNINKIGTYTAIYTVKDSDNNLVKWDRTIKVVEKGYSHLPIITPDNYAPTIKARKLYVPWGKDFNELDGVTALDEEDGNITHLVKVKGDINVGKPGVYTLTYKVIDSDGYSAYATRPIIIGYSGGNPNGKLPITNPNWGKNEKWRESKENSLPDKPTQPNQGKDGFDPGAPSINISTNPGESENIFINIDINDDGKPDINIDKDKDGDPDINVDIDGDNKADLNLDTNNDGFADTNIDTNGDNSPDLNIDIDGDNKSDINIDKDKDGDPDINIDIDGDNKADLNLDTNNDGFADTNIDTNGDNSPDLNIDIDGDNIADIKIDKSKYNPKTFDKSNLILLSLATTVSLGIALLSIKRIKIYKKNKE